MVIDFSKVNAIDKPLIVLKNLNDVPIAVIGQAMNESASLKLNEVSEFSFDLPREINGEAVPYYDLVVGMRYIEVKDLGVFLLVDPSETSDGIKTIKSCKAYSREYELNLKKISLENSTYRLCNPLDYTDASTIMGIVLEKFPSWSVGEVDPSLWTKYRTFEVSDQTCYDFLKNTAQESYGCIFDFDTVNRTINIISTADAANISPVFLSFNNLIKEIQVDENSSEIVTQLACYGADGVTIRNVNPTGTNYLYNLDYFMTEDNFPSATIKKWAQWKDLYDANQDVYYAMTLQSLAITERYYTEQASLTDLKTNLATLNSALSVAVSLISSGEYIDGSDQLSEAIHAVDGYLELGYNCSSLADLKTAITDMESKIASKEALLLSIRNDTAQTGEYYDNINKMKAINDTLKLESFFDDYICEVCGGSLIENGGTYTCSHCGTTTDSPSLTEYKLIDRYLIEDSLEDSSFVIKTVSSYDTSGKSRTADGSEMIIQGTYICDKCGGELSYDEASVQYVCQSCQTSTGSPVHTAGEITQILGQDGKELYQVAGGTLQIRENDDASVWLTANIVSGVVDKRDDFTYTATFYLGSGSIVDASETDYFETGSLSISGTWSSLTAGGAYADEDFPDVYAHYSSIDCVFGGQIYFTQDTSASEMYSVQFDLFEYGQEALTRLAYPTYNFSIDAANFISLEQFEQFKNKLTFGNKVYVEVAEDKIMRPILIGAEIDWSDHTGLTLEFGDKYYSADADFALVDLLEQSVSLGKTLDLGKLTYSSFVDSGASNVVKDFISAALDVSKNAVLSSGLQAISWDDSGLRLRKRTEDGTGYEDEQIWMINNSICFTDDGWSSAKMAIGKFYDDNLGELWGIVAPQLVGTLIAGESLYIYSTKPDGENMSFQLDGDGAKLFNSQFVLQTAYTNEEATESYVGRIALNPSFGLMGGSVRGTDWHAFYAFDDNENIIGIKTEGGNTFTSVSDWAASSKNDKPIPNFWLDPYGDVYFEGTVYATDGKFTGIVDASDLLINGTSVLDLDNDVPVIILNNADIKLGTSPYTPEHDGVGYAFYADRYGNVEIGDSPKSSFGLYGANGCVKMDGAGLSLYRYISDTSPKIQIGSDVAGHPLMKFGQDQTHASNVIIKKYTRSIWIGSATVEALETDDNARRYPTGSTIENIGDGKSSGILIDVSTDGTGGIYFYKNGILSSSTAVFG